MSAPRRVIACLNDLDGELRAEQTQNGLNRTKADRLLFREAETRNCPTRHSVPTLDGETQPRGLAAPGRDITTIFKITDRDFWAIALRQNLSESSMVLNQRSCYGEVLCQNQGDSFTELLGNGTQNRRPFPIPTRAGEQAE